MNGLRLEPRAHSPWWLNLLLPLAAVGATLVLCSGLIVLAGANLPPKTDELGLPTGEDGILTAEEIVNLDRNVPPELLQGIRHIDDPGELSDQIKIKGNYSSADITYVGSPGQFKQVFWNLIGNALKAMPEGGELSVDFGRPKKNALSIRIVDSGRGMTAEEKARMFEPFYTRFDGGRGLGEPRTPWAGAVRGGLPPGRLSLRHQPGQAGHQARPRLFGGCGLLPYSLKILSWSIHENCHHWRRVWRHGCRP